MRVTSLLLTFFVFAGSRTAPAATVADLAVFNVIRQTDPSLVSDKIVYWNVVAPDLDLVIAIGSTEEWGQDTVSPTFYWAENRKRPSARFGKQPVDALIDAGCRCTSPGWRCELECPGYGQVAAPGPGRRAI